MDIVKCTSFASPSNRLMSRNWRSLMSERYALCFQQQPAALLYDNDNNNGAALAATPNDDPIANPLDNAIVTAALRLFGQYGLASANRAAQNAERCFWANDPLGHKWWMTVLRQLDNNLVASMQKSRPGGNISPMNITGNI